MGGASIVDYPVGELNSFCNSISDFSICNIHPDSNHCLLFFKRGRIVGSRLPTLSSQGQVLCPNPKKANQYVVNIKHELTYVQGDTYTSLDNHTQPWLHLILHIAQLILFKDLVANNEADHPTHGLIVITKRHGASIWC